MPRRAAMNKEKILGDARRQRKNRIEEMRQSHQAVGGEGYKRMRIGQRIGEIPQIEIVREETEDPEMLKIEDFNEDAIVDLKFNPLIIKSAPGLPIIALPYRHHAVDVSFNNQNILIEEEEKDIYNESPQEHQLR
jgi:hypothetical protein